MKGERGRKGGEGGLHEKKGDGEGETERKRWGLMALEKG